MELLPNETHRIELNIPGWDMVMACVDGHTNTWRLDPESEIAQKQPELRAQKEERITELMQQMWYDPDTLIRQDPEGFTWLWDNVVGRVKGRRRTLPDD